MDDFIHIPKTSGSSIRTVMARQYGLDGIAYFEPGKPLPEAKDAVGSLKAEIRAGKIRLVTGHHAFGLHNALDWPLRYFTMLRDPIARTASEYFYAYSYDHHRLRDAILSEELTPEAFLTEGVYADQFDLQCRMLAGKGDARIGLAKLAIETVERCFVAVGVAELFDESLLYLAKRLGWAPPLYSTRNVTRLPPDIDDRRQRIEACVRADFAALYAADFALHDHARRKLLRETADEGAAFTDALAAFRELQSILGASDDARKFDLYEMSRSERLPEIPPVLLESAPYRVIGDYLHSPATARRGARNYIGHVDRVERDRIGGWAVDLCRDEPIELRAYVNRRLIGSALASGDRPDVAAARATRRNVGFDMTLAESVGDRARLVVCYEDTDLSV